MIGSTGKFKVSSIIFNDGDFAIAQGFWDGKSQLSTACRWHEKDGIGYPQTFGKPQWRLLPTPDVEIAAMDSGQAPLVKLGFGKKAKPFYSLELIDSYSGEGVHTITSESPFGHIAVGEYVSVPGASFPDELSASGGRQVTRIQHVINEVDGMAWHSTMLTVQPPSE